MVGYSNNFGLDFDSLDQSDIPPRQTKICSHPSRVNVVDDIDLALSALPNWAMSVNRRSDACRRSTSKSLKRISAARHE